MRDDEQVRREIAQQMQVIRAEVPFDYESKVWGGAEVYAKPTYIQGVKLAGCLRALRGVEGKVADIGCGAGNVAKAIKRERPELSVYGVDLAENAIEFAKRDPQGVEFRLGVVERLPFEDGELSAVTMFDVLEHVPDPEHVLREINRVLKPGGLFHLVVPLEDEPWTMYRWLTRRGWQGKRKNCGHIQFFSDRSYKQMAASLSLPVESASYSFQPLFQAIDIAYFMWLLRRGPVGVAVEDYVASQSGFKQRLMKFGKGAIAAIGWYEAKLCQFMPAGTGHYNCRKPR